MKVSTKVALPDILGDVLPIVTWLPRYRRADLGGDLIAGLVVAVMIVPQAMAYALLAGLPAEVGLYSSVLPLAVYAVFGASRSMSVGPTALVSLLVAATVTRFAPEGGAHAAAVAGILAMLVGTLQLGMGILRLGFVINFLSQPVVAGFTVAAAVAIGLTQVAHLVGITLRADEPVYSLLPHVLSRWRDFNPATLGVAALSVIVLWAFKAWLTPFLRRRGIREGVARGVAKTGPLVVVLLAGAATAGFQLVGNHGVAVVGFVPAGLPDWSPPRVSFDEVGQLTLAALTITFVAFMESLSIGKILAGQHRRAIEPNLELRAFGAANLAAAFTGGFPVSSGLSRSLISHTAGARTGLAAFVTAACVALTLLFATQLFAYLPKATLAAIVVVTISGLVRFAPARKLYLYSKADFAAYLLTGVVVFAAGVQIGVAVGFVATVLLFLWRASHPHIAVLGRVAHTEHFRDILNHPVETCPNVVAVRIDESLFFANARFLEENILRLAAAQPGIKDLVLVCSAVNAIDATALETLERLVRELGGAHVRFHLADVKGPVLTRLIRAGFIERLGPDRLHLSAHEAMEALGCGPDGPIQEMSDQNPRPNSPL